MPLNDGLGYEELGQAGSQVASLFLTGSIASESQISGLNVFATGSVQTDKVVGDTMISGAKVYSAGDMQGENVIGDTKISGANIWSAGSVIGDEVIGDVMVSGAAVYSHTVVTAKTNVAATGSVSDGGNRRICPTGTGSPTTWGIMCQAGSSALGAGSNVWLIFGTAFGAAPVSVIALTENGGTDGNNDLQVGSLVAGSCYIEGKTASEAFYWAAFGATG